MRKLYTGRIYTRKESPYYWIEINTEPKKIRESTKIPIKGGRKTEATALLNERLYKLNNGQKITDDILLCDYLKSFLEVHKLKLKENTYNSYHQAIYNHIIPYFEPQKLYLRELNGDDITRFLYHLKTKGRFDGQGLSDKSVKNYRGVLAKALEKAVAEELIHRNPIKTSELPLSIMSQTESERETYEQEEVKQLLSSAKENNPDIYLFLMLVLNTGCRKGEILGLTWDKVDFEAMTIEIAQSRTGNRSAQTHKLKETKTRSSNRIIRINEELCNLLKEEYRSQQENRKIFGKQYIDDYDLVIRRIDGGMPSPNHINDKVYRAMKKAGLEKITVHDLRHTFATLVCEAGGNIWEVSKALGHSEVRTTDKLYVNRKKLTSQDITDKITSILS